MNEDEGIAHYNDEPYPQKWPKCNFRPHEILQISEHQSLQQAFQWPSIVREVLNQHIQDLGGDCLAGTDVELTLSSHWSGVCTQSQGAKILQSNGVTKCKFRHVRVSAVNPSVFS